MNSLSEEAILHDCERHRTTPEDDEIFTHCFDCGGEIYVGQLYYVFDGNPYCQRCNDDHSTYAEND